jgi:8-oxo-dGTP pyrophosphatase MutT (NUDIX family)
MTKEISAGIIIYRKTKVGIKFLILYHGRGYWNFPKGKIEEETSFQAALREIKEETGLTRNDLKFYQPFKAYEKFTFWRRLPNKSEKIAKLVIFYLAETKKNTIHISEEHEGYGWFTYKEALRILSKHQDSRRVIAQAYQFLKSRLKNKKRQSNSPKNSLKTTKS